MKSEIKFALFCCIFFTLVSVLLAPLQGGWLMVLIVQYLGFPLGFLAAEIASHLGLQFSILNMFIIININIFIIAYLLSKVYFSLKRLIKNKLSRAK